MAKTEKFVDESGAEYEFAVRADNVLPILEKSWTGLIASANASSGNGCDLILGEFNVVGGTNWILEVEIDANYTASDWSGNNATSNHICHVEGYGNAPICSSMWNNIRSTTYRPFYNFVVYRPSSSANKFYFGICLYNCNKNTDANNKRNVTCRVRLAKNLTNVALHDAPANTDYTTYYQSMNGRSAYDCYNNGLRESGDDNTSTNIYARDITGYCGTAAGTAAKSVDCGQFDYTDSKVFKVYFANTNTASAPTLNVNSQGAKPLYLLTGDNTWVVADATNKTITAGSHWVYYIGSKFYILPDACNSSSISTDNAFLVGQASYAVKNVFCSGVYLAKGGTFRIYIRTTNTNTGDLSLNVNLSGEKPIYLDGTRCNGTTKNLAGGKWYDVVYDGTQYNAYSNAGTIVYPKATNADIATKATQDSDGYAINNYYLRTSPSGSYYGFKITKSKAGGIYDNYQFSIFEGYSSNVREHKIAIRWAGNHQMDGTIDYSIRRLLVSNSGLESSARTLKIYVGESESNYYCYLLWVNNSANTSTACRAVYPAGVGFANISYLSSAQDLTALTAVNYYSDETVARMSDLGSQNYLTASKLTSSNDLNLIKGLSKRSYYRWEMNSIPANAPFSGHAAWMLVSAAHSDTYGPVQEVHNIEDSEKYYVRQLMYSTWTSWKEVYYEATSTYSSTGTQAVNGTAVASAINALDVTDAAVAGQVVSAVSETNGKIAVSRRALVAADIPNLDASKITSGMFDIARGESYTLQYHRPTTSTGTSADGKHWTKFAWKTVSNYSTASVWDSCDGEFDVYEKSYGNTGHVKIGTLVLSSRWGHGAGSGYSFKTTGDKYAMWQEYNTSVCTTSMATTGSSAGKDSKLVVKIVCDDTNIEWWIANTIWDTSVYIRPRFKINFTGITSNTASGAVLKTFDEFTTYCEDKYTKDCQYGGQNVMFHQAKHVSHTSNLIGYKELTFTDANSTWANFIAGASNTNSFCYKLFGDSAFDDTEYTVRAIGRLNLSNSGNEIAATIGIGSYPQYEVCATRQGGYVKFFFGSKMRICGFNRYGAIVSTSSSFVGNVIGNLDGKATHVDHTSVYGAYKVIYPSKSTTWATFISSASTTESFSNLLFGSSFDGTDKTVRAIGHMNLSQSTSSGVYTTLGMGLWPEYEVSMSDGHGYVRFFGQGKTVMYSMTATGSIDTSYNPEWLGKAASAAKDGNGSVITTTYATKSDLSGKKNTQAAKEGGATMAVASQDAQGVVTLTEIKLPYTYDASSKKITFSNFVKN